VCSPACRCVLLVASDRRARLHVRAEPSRSHALPVADRTALRSGKRAKYLRRHFLWPRQRACHVGSGRSLRRIWRGSLFLHGRPLRGRTAWSCGATPRPHPLTEPTGLDGRFVERELVPTRPSVVPSTVTLSSIGSGPQRHAGSPHRHGASLASGRRVQQARGASPYLVHFGCVSFTVWATA
jgi:hypothetical protein